MASRWSLRDNKSPQISRTLLSILVDLNIVGMVSIFLLISKMSSPLSNRLVIIPSAPFTIGITVAFWFHGFLVLKQGLDINLSFRFLLCLLSYQPVLLSPQFGWFFFSG